MATKRKPARMPSVTCPKCQRVHHSRDVFDMGEGEDMYESFEIGDNVYCPCGREIVILEIKPEIRP